MCSECGKRWPPRACGEAPSKLHQLGLGHLGELLSKQRTQLHLARRHRPTSRAERRPSTRAELRSVAGERVAAVGGLPTPLRQQRGQ